MAIVELPPDGAAKRFKASHENAMSDNEGMGRRYNHIDSLKNKVQAGEVLRSFKAHPGFVMLQNYCETEWAFKRIMNEMKNNKDNPEMYKYLMIQRDAIESLFAWIDLGIKRGDEARLALAEEEKKK